MSDSAKQVLVSVGIAIAFLFIYSYIRKEKETVASNGNKKYVIPEADPSMEGNPELMDAYAALCAYIEAFNAGEDETFLKQLNAEFQKEFGLMVYENTDGSISVEDSSGKEILVSQQIA